MICGQTLSIFLRLLCLYVKSAMLKWQFIPMIRHGVFLACRELLQARMLLLSFLKWYRVSITVSLFAQAHWVQVLKMIWLKLLRQQVTEFILLTSEMFQSMTNGLTKQLTKVQQAHLICMRLLRLCRRLDLTAIFVLTTAE